MNNVNFGINTNNIRSPFCSSPKPDRIYSTIILNKMTRVNISSFSRRLPKEKRTYHDLYDKLTSLWPNLFEPRCTYLTVSMEWSLLAKSYIVLQDKILLLYNGTGEFIVVMEMPERDT